MNPRLFAVFAFAFVASTPVARAQLTTRTWNQGANTGQWNIGSNWTPAGVPNGPSDRAVIDGGLAANADVVLSADQTIASLDVTAGDGLRLNPNITLTLSRPSAGHVFVGLGGTLSIGTGTLKLNGAATLDGFGTATLAGGSIGATNPPASGGGGVFDRLNNRATLRGHGTVIPAVNNLETVQANVPGQTLTLSTVTDNFGGVLEAVNGGRLVLGDASVSVITDQSTIANGSDGLIRASGAGSVVDFHGGISGGQIQNDGGTFRSVGGQTEWTNLQVAGGRITFQPDPALPAATGRNVLTLAGVLDLPTGLRGTCTIDNRGEVVFEGAHPSGQSLIAANGPVVLQGGGTLKLLQGGPNTGGPVSFERLNFPGERLTNGRPIPPADTPADTDRHRIEGGANFQVQVVNQPAGVIHQPANAVAPLFFQNTVTNFGDITSDGALQFAAVYGIEPSGNQFLLNEPGGLIQTNAGTLDLGTVRLVNEGNVHLKGGTVATMRGTVENLGTFELSGGATLGDPASVQAVFVNRGTLRIGDASALTLKGRFDQTASGTTVFGVQSATQFGRINVNNFSGGSASKLAGRIAASIPAGFSPPTGTKFPLLDEDVYQGRFDNSLVADLPGNATLKITYNPFTPPSATFFKSVTAEVVAAQKVTATQTQTVTALRDLYLAMKAQAGASLTAGFLDALFSSLGGDFQADPTGRILLALAAGTNLTSDGDFSASRGPVELEVPPTASFRVQSFNVAPVASVKFTGAADTPVISRGGFTYNGAATKDYSLDGGTLSSRISQQFNNVQNIVAVGGGNFESLRAAVTDAVLSFAPWREGALNPDWIIETTRIIAMGGNNIVANGGGNFSLTSAGRDFASTVHFRLEEFHTGANPNALTNVANLLTFPGNRFTDPAKLLPVISGIVAVGGGNFGAVTTERIAQIIANGGGNFSDNLDLFQAANIVAVGGGNIVALGGGNFTGVGELLPLISNSINSFSVANIIANGGGNIIANGGGNFDFGSFSPRPAGDAARAPRPFLRAPVQTNDGPGGGSSANLNHLVVNGDFVQSKQALTRLQVAGLDAHDQVVVTGTATLDGALGVLFADPDDLLNPAATFAPPSGTWFDVLVAPRFNVVAGFELRLPKLAAGQTWTHAFADRGDGTGALRLFVNGPNGPEIAVEQPAGSPVADGGTRAFGNVPVGGSGTLTFTVTNPGDWALTGLGTTFTGPNADEFTVTTRPVNPVRGLGGSTTFSVTFSPTGAGTRTATLRLASNDADENPYDLVLTGGGTVPEIDLELQPANAPLANFATVASGPCPWRRPVAAAARGPSPSGIPASPR